VFTNYSKERPGKRIASWYITKQEVFNNNKHIDCSPVPGHSVYYLLGTQLSDMGAKEWCCAIYHTSSTHCAVVIRLAPALLPWVLFWLQETGRWHAPEG